MLNLKQRVFIDIMNQIPYGSNKMAKKDHVSSDYSDELIADNKSIIYQRAVVATEKRLGRRLQDSDAWFVHCDLIEIAYREVEDARAWLLAEGYIREYVRINGTKKQYYYGLTDKGWKVAPKYKRLSINN